jgi:outer membrane protein assembly factor BamB
LRHLTRKHFDFVAGAPHEERALAAAKWRQWLAEHGETAKLHLPAKPEVTSSHLPEGHMLMTLGWKLRVIEVDAVGKTVWSYRASWPWSARKLANGNVLIGDYGGKGATEVTPNGRIAWQYPARANNAKELPDGSILIAEGNGNRRYGHRVLEVHRDSKKLLWEYKTPRPCTDAQALPNGNILFSIPESAFEMTREYEIVWQYKLKDSSIRGLQRLRNGNTLIADFGGRVIEISPEGAIVWQFNLASATDAFRLPNGNTLVAGGWKFVEVTPDKRILWSRQAYNFGMVRKGLPLSDRMPGLGLRTIWGQPSTFHSVLE